MTARILAYTSPGEVRAAAVDGGELVDVAIHRPGRPDGVGDLHRGRVAARVPALGGVFVSLADGEGFLPDKAGGTGLVQGGAVGVRVVRAAQGGKGPRLAVADDADAGTGSPTLLRRGPGAVERLAALHPSAEAWTADPALAAELRPALGDRVRLVSLLETDAAEAIEALGEASAILPGGLRGSFHPTPALTAIDVDTGSATARDAPKGTAQRELNRAALPGIARQVRLRNLSGAILLDLAGMPPAKRQALGPDLAQALAADPLRPKLLGFTRLGLAEIVRTRVHPPLHEVLRGPHAAALAALRRIAEAGSSASPLALRAAPDVVSALRADEVALRDLARRLGRDTYLRSDPRLPTGTAVVEEEGPARASRA